MDKPNKKIEGYTEIQSTFEYWKGEKVGDKIEGIYERTYIDQGKKERFVLRNGSREFVLPPAMSVRNKMVGVELKKHVIVVYDGQEEETKGDGEPRKKYLVYVKD